MAETQLTDEDSIIYADDADLILQSGHRRQEVTRINNYSVVAQSRQIHIQWKK